MPMPLSTVSRNTIVKCAPLFIKQTANGIRLEALNSAERVDESATARASIIFCFCCLGNFLPVDLASLVPNDFGNVSTKLGTNIVHTVFI